MSGRLGKLELYGLKITMWAIVVLCFTGIVLKMLMNGKPRSVPVYYLLILAVAASVLAVLVPKLESYLSRITEINVGGFKLVLAHAVRIGELLKAEAKEITPTLFLSKSSLNSAPADQPFYFPPLGGHQRYWYEKVSAMFYQGLYEFKNPDTLSDEDRGKYRELLKILGIAAFRMQHYTKYLDIVSHLENFKDKGLDAEEIFSIGHAYLWAADEQTEESQQALYWARSLTFLTTAVQKNPQEVKYVFSLGVAQLSLNQYKNGIESMKKSIQIDATISVWAKWNMACAYKKLDRDEEALLELGGIPRGPWWPKIAGDDWFKEEQNTPFTGKFAKLCERKINQEAADFVWPEYGPR